MKPQDIVPGESYACEYTDLSGKICTALILVRDSEKEMLRLRDLETGIEFTCEYTEVQNIDTVEWV